MASVSAAKALYLPDTVAAENSFRHTSRVGLTANAAGVDAEDPRRATKVSIASSRAAAVFLSAALEPVRVSAKYLSIGTLFFRALFTMLFSMNSSISKRSSSRGERVMTGLLAANRNLVMALTPKTIFLVASSWT